MAWNDDQKNQGIGDKHEKPEWELLLEKKWRHFKQQTRAFFRKNSSEFEPKKLIGYSLITLSILWMLSGIYIVDQGNRGIVTRFGAYHATTQPGPHWHLPAPIENVTIVNIENQRFIEIGYRSDMGRRNSGTVLPESSMLTKDENIINLRLAVQYQIKNARNFLFNVKDNTATLKQITESVTRAVIGKNTMDFILTEGRSQIVSEIKEEIQSGLDLFSTGLQVSSVNLQDAQPPEQVQSAFEDAIKAREDKQRLINEAQAYANEIIPKARGTAARMLQEAEAYEAQQISRAKGESKRFEQLLVEYQKSPGVTRKRLYLEAKERLYGKTNKVMMTVDNGNSMFYMPLNNTPQPTVNHQKQIANSGAETTNMKDSNPKAQRINVLRPSRSQK